MKTGITHRLMHHKLPRAITFDPTVGFSRSIPFQKQEVKIFPRVSRSTQRKFQGPPPRNFCRGYKKPKHPSDRRGDHFFWVLLSTWFFYTFFPLPNKKNTHKTQEKTHTHTHTHTHIKASWFFYLHQKHKVLFLYPIFFSLILQFGW